MIVISSKSTGEEMNTAKKKGGGEWFIPQMWLIKNYFKCQNHTERIRIKHTAQDFTYE